MKVEQVDKRTTKFTVEKPVVKKSKKQGNKAPDNKESEKKNQEA